MDIHLSIRQSQNWQLSKPKTDLKWEIDFHYCNKKDERFAESIKEGLSETAALSKIDDDLMKLLPNLKKKLLEESLRKPTFKNGVYDQTKVNDLLKNIDMETLLN